MDSCTYFNLLVILSCSFHSLPPKVVLWVATQLFCAGPNLNLKVNSAPVHKCLNLISGLTFKFKVVPYPSVTCCVTHSNDVFMWSSHPLETRDLTKQTNWKMCVTLHLLKTFEPFELLVALSFLAIQTISPFFCGQLSASGCHFTNLWSRIDCQEVVIIRFCSLDFSTAQMNAT